MDLRSRVEWIELYLTGKLSPEENLHFENRITEDDKLKAEVNELRNILEGISRRSERADWIKQMHADLKNQGKLKGYSNYKGS